MKTEERLRVQYDNIDDVIRRLKDCGVINDGQQSFTSVGVEQ